jgi:hypothetical protein
MGFLQIVAGAGVLTIGLMGCAFSHTTTKHYVSHHSAGVAHHGQSHAPARKSWHSSKPIHGRTVTHPPGTGHAKGYHGAKAPHSWKHHYSSHRTYHKPAPPPRVPGKTTDGRYVLPGGMESVCAGGTPPPCQ